jgi:hypothetical protein
MWETGAVIGNYIQKITNNDGVTKRTLTSWHYTLMSPIGVLICSCQNEFAVSAYINGRTDDRGVTYHLNKATNEMEIAYTSAGLGKEDSDYLVFVEAGKRILRNGPWNEVKTTYGPIDKVAILRRPPVDEL